MQILTIGKLEDAINNGTLALPMIEEVKSSVDPWAYRDETG